MEPSRKYHFADCFRTATIVTAQMYNTILQLLEHRKDYFKDSEEIWGCLRQQKQQVTGQNLYAYFIFTATLKEWAWAPISASLKKKKESSFTIKNIRIVKEIWILCGQCRYSDLLTLDTNPVCHRNALFTLFSKVKSSFLWKATVLSQVLLGQKSSFTFLLCCERNKN